MPPTPRTYAEVLGFITDFEALRLPKARWTHEGHLVAGLWYVWHFGPASALEQLRIRIRSHNTSVGTPNTDSGGYHETITRLYVESIDDFRNAAPGETFEQVLGRLLASPLTAKTWPLTRYSSETLFSTRARHEWVPPEYSTNE